MASRSPVKSFNISAGSLLVQDTPATYYGLTVRNTDVVVGVIRVWDNNTATASGVLLETVSVPAGESVNIFYNVNEETGGVRAPKGIYYEKVSGTFEGSLRASG